MGVAKYQSWLLTLAEVYIYIYISHSSYKLNYLFIIPSEPQVSQEEMAAAKVPINLRDYCAHLYIPLMKCRKDNYYLPWRCKKEKHAWDDCEFQE